MKKRCKLYIITSALLLLNSFLFINFCEAAWDGLTTRATSSGSNSKLDSPHLLKLQDGRTMLTFFWQVSGVSDTCVYYQISDNGAWSPSIKIANTEGGHDPTVTQDPSNGKIIVAYAKYYIFQGEHKADVSITTIEPNVLSSQSGGVNNGWTLPQQVVHTDTIRVNDFVPDILALSNNGSTKLLIVYAHGCEPAVCGIAAQNAVLQAVSSMDGGATWTAPTTIYDTKSDTSSYFTSTHTYMASKPSCADMGNASDILCSYFIRDVNTSNESVGYLGDSGIFTISSHNSLASWDRNARQVYAISTNQHKWSFLLNDGKEFFLAYTTRNGGSPNSGNFVNRLASSIDGGITWSDYGIISGLTTTAAWPALARRYAYNPLSSGITAAWSDDAVERDDSGPFNIYTENLRYAHVIAPQGGETWSTNLSQNIFWNYSFMNTQVEIDVSRDGGATWPSIVSSTSNNGSYSWQVTSPAGTNCRVKVTDGTYYDISNNFSICASPAASFNAAPLTGYAPFEVSFTNTTTGAVNTWSWNLNDGYASSLQSPPPHTFRNQGTYAVSLMATNSCASSLFSLSIDGSATCPNGPAKIGTLYYQSLSSAVFAASCGDLILAQATVPPESITIAKSVTIDGGYLCDYSRPVTPVPTILNGNITIGSGSFTVTMSNVTIQ